MPRFPSAERDHLLTETRRLLLDAATEEFARKGYVEANVNRISQAAGFAKGTIYNYFESKRSLMLAMIEEIAALHFEFVAKRVRREGDAGRRLACFFAAGFDFVATHLAQALVMVNNLYGPDAEFKEVMYQAYQPMFELVAVEIVALGISQGLFRPLDPAATANLIMNTYLGAASQVNEDGVTWLAAGQVADFVLNGLHR